VFQTVTLAYATTSGIEIKKYTNGQDADTAPGPQIENCDQVVWTYEVRLFAPQATGPLTPLSNIVVVDDDGNGVAPPNFFPTRLADNPGNNDNILEQGEVWRYQAVDGTPALGQYVNRAQARGTAPDGVTYSDTDLSHYFGVPCVPDNPSVDLIKSTNGDDANTPTGPYIPAGGAVNWTYEVTNTGNVALTDVVVTDDQGVVVTCPATSLAVGASMTCTANGVAVAGQYANLGIVSGKSPDGAQVADDDPSHYFGSNPAIAIVKKTNGDDANAAPGPNIPVGGAVTWTYEVTNTGNVTLTNVTVTDDQIANDATAINCGAGNNIIASLAVGASATCTATGTAVAGQYANIGTATGTPPVGPNVSASDPSHYFGVETPDGGEGCTPGYWKNHTGSWPAPYATGNKYNTVFGVTSTFGSSFTLLDALEQGGGGEKALGRHAVAALLNAASADVDYEFTVAEVIAMVQGAYVSGDYEGVKDQLAAENERGCPLGKDDCKDDDHDSKGWGGKGSKSAFGVSGGSDDDCDDDEDDGGNDCDDHDSKGWGGKGSKSAFGVSGGSDDDCKGDSKGGKGGSWGSKNR